MKKTISLLLALVLCLSLCACGTNNQSNETHIAELERQIVDLEQQISNNDGVIQDLTAKINEYEQQIDKYGWMIGYIEDSNYDAIINQLNQMKENEKKAELEAKGIVEIVITIDNWDQYFEYIPSGYAYIRNSFNEITHMNMCGGLKLKDEYSMVENGGTTVSFEMETYIETRSCTVDFTTGTFEYGEVVKQGDRFETKTTKFSDYHYNDTTYFGSIHQVNSDNGKQITTEISIAAVSQMLRAEGVLYIYQD